jgi:N-acetylglucosaminyldiphosphoundecaprenol N-acetyl-beta-D-mannosaminyltransferase
MKLIGKHFEVDINIASRTALFDEVRKRFAAGQGFALATINLDHVTKLENSPEFRAAYAAQDLIVADGNPIVWTSKLAGDPLDLIPGSELVLPLAKLAAETGAPVALIGSNDASLAGAAETLNDHAPEINIVLQHAPAYGFDPTGDAARALLAQIDASGAQLVFIALGAPKQEHFAALGRTLAPKAGFASVGAGLDFLSGTQVRAPLWVRKIAMEWLWRLLSNPRRLFWRYAMCFMVLPGLVIRSRKAR